MEISVVIPAFEAEETLAATLTSLLAQTCADFEAIVVDDGSSDGTARIAAGIAARDARVRARTTRHAGAAAARNLGLEEARGELVLFLDADDLLAPPMLEKTRAALHGDPGAAAAYCGWSRIAGDGSIVPHEFFRTAGDLFPVLACIQPFAIHTCLARREVLVAVGGFDPSLVTCEDWDLWQRIARTGRSFACVPEVLALYRTKPGSASQEPRRMLLDGLAVVDRGMRPDPRVRRPAAAWADGVASALGLPHRYRLLAWSAGLAIGRGEDPSELSALATPAPCPGLDPAIVADALVQAVLLPRGERPSAWAATWPRVAPSIAALALDLERRSGAPGLARGATGLLERAIADRVARPLRIGRTWAVDRDPFAAIADLEPPPGVEVVRSYVATGDGAPRAVELPVFDGRIPAALVADAVAAELAWPLLHMYMPMYIEPRLRFVEEAGRTVAWSGSLLLAGDLPAGRDAAARSLRERCGWALFLQELWGRPEWPEDRFYDVKPEDAETVRTGGSRHAVEVSHELPDLVTDAPWLDVEVRVGGVAIGEVRIAVAAGRIAASRLRAEITTACGFELARAAIREAVLGRPLGAGPPLRERLRERAAVAASTTQQAFPRRRRRDIETSTSRRAVLPAAVFAELAAAARSAHEPVAAEPLPHRPVAYAPHVIRPDAPEAAEDEPAPDPPTTGRRHGPDTERLAILMHHRVAARGPAEDRPYRLDPGVFEERLAMLRALGYATVRLRDWRAAMVRHAPFHCRALVFTFDDATRDFGETAWPLLKRYGFGATLFVPTGAVDDGRYTDPLTGAVHPSLGWDEIAALDREGVEIGSHTVRHPFLTRLSPEEVVRELAASRARLQERLGHAVHALAYPFGDTSPLVQHLAGACGYLYGLTCRGAASGLWEPLLALPRIDVSRNDGIAPFARALGLHAPEPVLHRAAS